MKSCGRSRQAGEDRFISHLVYKQYLCANGNHITTSRDEIGDPSTKNTKAQGFKSSYSCAFLNSFCLCHFGRPVCVSPYLPVPLVFGWLPSISDSHQSHAPTGSCKLCILELNIEQVCTNTYIISIAYFRHPNIY